MVREVLFSGDKIKIKMLMNRVLPLILLLVISRPAAADAFWVLGSFLDEDVARVDGSRISNDAGIEVLLFESIVNSRVQFRLLTGVKVAPADQAVLRQQLMKVGVSDQWALRFDASPPYMETIYSDKEVGNALSAAELVEIDSMLSDFEYEYTEGELMKVDMSAQDISSELAGASLLSGAGNFVVVGSYGSIQSANDYVKKLGNAFPEVLSHDVTVKRKEVSGEIVHRVMIGPVRPIEERGLMDSLSQRGFRGGWLLPRITAPRNIGPEGSGQNQGLDLDTDQDISEPQAKVKSPDQSDRQSSVRSVESYREQDDFNLVRLRRGSVKFPDPRNKH
jgi:hypothetical protein